MNADAVLWHDLECGAYAVDLALWRELADAEAGPVLDVGAGTGRVALDLARRGHAVVAVDVDPTLLAALEQRAGGLPVSTVTADARALALDRTFGLVIVPMQTVQLFGGATGRAAFLGCCRSHLGPGGLLAVALADALEAVADGYDEPPLPDLRELDGVVYSSRPLAVRDEGGQVAIERRREVVDRSGTRAVDDDVVRLDRLDATTLAAEMRAHGLTPLGTRQIPATADYVGSTVVLARG